MNLGLTKETYLKLFEKHIQHISQYNPTPEEIGDCIQKAFYDHMDSNEIYDWMGKQKDTQLQFFNQMVEYIPSTWKQQTGINGKDIHDLWYKSQITIPRAGTIILNLQMTKVLLVQCPRSGKLGYPKGKKLKGQSFLEGAKRQTLQQIKIRIQIDENTQKIEMAQKPKLGKGVFYIVILAQELISSEEIKEKNSEVKSIKWYEIQTINHKKLNVYAKYTNKSLKQYIDRYKQIETAISTNTNSQQLNIINQQLVQKTKKMYIQKSNLKNPEKKEKNNKKKLRYVQKLYNQKQKIKKQFIKSQNKKKKYVELVKKQE